MVRRFRCIWPGTFLVTTSRPTGYEYRHVLQQRADRFDPSCSFVREGRLLLERSVVHVRLTGRGDMQRTAGKDQDSRNDYQQA